MRRHVLRLILSSFACLLYSLAANSAGPTATINWTVPTKYTSGEDMPASDIASYTVSWSHTPTGPIVGTQTVASPTTTTTVNGLICGKDYFIVTVTTTSQALYPNETSDPSNQALYPTGTDCKPNPVTGVTAS